MKIPAINIWVAALVMASISASAGPNAQVPIKGEFNTEFVFTAPPPLAQLTVTGTGLVSHLGAATCFTDNEAVDFAHQPLPTVTATITLTSANGDTLTLDFAGFTTIPAADGSLAFSGPIAFTGGTGHFAGATGKGELVGHGTPQTPTAGVGWFMFEGTISSLGASKN